VAAANIVYMRDACCDTSFNTIHIYTHGRTGFSLHTRIYIYSNIRVVYIVHERTHIGTWQV